ncbi:hypothetical protein [Amycolatopsis sp. NPDC059657]|uniref:hypothetical protein n=1 Tax=Amycolatopsis sp. NPDC059657 TaxID=3346899 RepID=UPI00366CD947
MRGLPFLADVVETGEVLGLDPQLPPEKIGEVLGDYAENHWHDAMTRDYGLVEFSWLERPDGNGWWGHHFTVQVHRLSRKPNKTAGKVIRARYGKFDKQFPFEVLRAELERRGIELIEVDKGAGLGAREYWNPAAHVSIFVIDEDGDPINGMVWAISSADMANFIATRPYKGQDKALWRVLKHLMPLDDAAREQWAEDVDEPYGWWLKQFQLLRERIESRDQPKDREAWIRLQFWVIEHGAFTDAQRALLYDGCRWIGEYYPEWAALVPTVDQVVRRCLDAITGDDLTPDTKTLVDAARYHAEQVEDPALAARLREWTARRFR